MELQESNSSNVRISTTTMSEISKEEEIKAIINTLKVNNVETEDISYVKASTKYERVFDKFYGHCSKGLAVNDFNLVEAVKSLSKEDSKKNEEELNKIKELRTIVSKSWEGKKLTSAENDSFVTITSAARGRKLFSNVLNEYRTNAIFTMSTEGYERLTHLLYNILYQIEKSNDVEAAMSVMILAQTFYIDNSLLNEETKGEKIFLQCGIQKHSIWTKKSLWEQAIDTVIKQEIKGQDMGDETEEEKEMQKRNIIFGKLGAFANNMLYFDTDSKQVENVIIAYAKKSALCEPHIMALKVTNYNNI